MGRLTHTKHALTLFVLFMAVWTPYRMFTGRLLSPPVLYVVDAPAKLLALLGLTLLLAKKLDGAGPEWVGLKKDGLAKALLLGLAGGALAWVGHFLLLPAIMGWDVEVTLAELDLSWLTYALYVVGIVGVSEEVMDRGYIFQEVARDLEGRQGVLLAALLSSGLFAASHIPINVFVYRAGLTGMLWHLLGVFWMGMVFALYMRVSGNLAAPAALHSLWDLLVGTINVSSRWGWSIAVASEAIGLTLAVLPPALILFIGGESSR
mgnify:CR=1 FL=1